MPSSDQPWVLGVSASHNGAACLLKGDRIVVAIQEERILGLKRAPINLKKNCLAINYCLQYAKITPADLDCIVLSSQSSLDDPSNTYTDNPIIQQAINAKIELIGHHKAHAYSAFAPSGFDDAAVLVIDGMGSPVSDLDKDEQKAIVGNISQGSETISLYDASGTTLTPLEKHLVTNHDWLKPYQGDVRMADFASLGGIFSSCAGQIFGSYSDAGKVMGLAPYGSPTIAAEEFFSINNGGLTFHNNVPKRFTFSERWPQHQQLYADLACSAQQALEEAILYLTRQLKQKSNSKNFVYAGGVALNSVANERIVRESGFENVYIIPPAEDSGAALGAAYYGLWSIKPTNTKNTLKSDSLGAVYSESEIDTAINNSPWVEVINDQASPEDVAELIANNNIIGFFAQGSELGPRSLGQRSILCDPRRKDAKKVLNDRVKHREGFRPFAPVILAEEVANWFDLEGTHPESPFMLRVLRFRENAEEKVPGVTHCDGSGRVQTVTKENNGQYYEVLKAFHAKTGVPILINTSLNVMGEPIVETPEDTLYSLAMTDLDYIFIGNKILGKKKRFKSALDFYPYFLQPDSLQAAKTQLQTSRQLQVSTPWGEANLPIHDPLTLQLAIDGADGLINGKTKARSVLKHLQAKQSKLSQSAFIRSLVQLRRGRVIGLSTTPKK
ncbi:carbamoyltransferase [Oceanicoccus sagamiensis]|uniref:Carbamoyltransferase n=1 Tax=Oceanicoccus sagamiensis TaxID=716816 RepID=A0A1X9NIB8_9GAMM|nr:carbamoyltransferase C-terminal domain-containing protein [Oceanicoccus sagamiensis]ARN76132.1 hypothetical protein BST96_19740 [Oceanicoccus sagamiensis]